MLWRLIAPIVSVVEILLNQEIYNLCTDVDDITQLQLWKGGH